MYDYIQSIGAGVGRHPDLVPLQPPAFFGQQQQAQQPGVNVGNFAPAYPFLGGSR